MSKPVKEIKVGAIRLAVWENELENGKAYSFSLSKNYRDKNGGWQTTSSIKSGEAMFAIMALQKALEFVYLKDKPEVQKEVDDCLI